MTYPAPEPDFVPAASRRHIAGWTPARQADFVAALAEGHSVRDAAASVGLTPKSAYGLRRSPRANDFGRAWDAAVAAGAMRLTETALDRALHGERHTVYYRGRAVGERIVHDNRLLLALLSRQRVARAPVAKSEGE